MGLTSWIQSKLYGDYEPPMPGAPAPKNPWDSVGRMYANAYGDAVAREQAKYPEMPEWIDTADGAVMWKQAQEQARMQQQAIGSASPYSDWATRSSLNWKFASDTTNSYPKDGDVISASSIANIVRAEMEKGVAKAIVKCQHCGQWAARFCSCGKCGAPVD